MKKIKLNKKSWTILAVAVFSTGLFLFLRTTVFAAEGSGTGWVTWLVGGLAQGIASILGWILVKLMAVLVQVAQYNNFIRSAAIVNGWVIARDVANMFFVVILLIIAFATILRIENYSYKKWLPKLILMAILINFSKTICGLLIDLSQVVMLTFVNAFKDVAAAGLVDMLGITGWQSLDGIEEVGGWTVASAYVLSVIYLVITLITVTAMVGMLVMRIVMIWVYVVLSPFAYLLAAFPGGAKYSSQWWSEFTKNLIVGPVLAFFIWLSFTSLVSFNDNGNDVAKDFQDTSGAADITCQTGDDGECKYGTSDLMIKFIVAIAMLLGGMKIAQEIGGAAGGIAGKGLAKVAALGAGTVAFGKKWGTKAITGDNLLARETMKGAKFDFRPIAIANAVKSSYAQKKQKDENIIRDQGIKNLGAGGFKSVLGGVGAGTDWANNYVSGFLGVKGVIRAGKEIVARPSQRKEKAAEMDKINEDMSAHQEYLEKNISTSDKAEKIKEIKLSASKIGDLDSQINDLRMRKISNPGGFGKEDETKLRALNKAKTEVEEKNNKNKEDIAKTEVSDADYKNVQDNLSASKVVKNTLKEEIDRIAPPQALEGLGAYRKTINESKSKYKDETNSDKLIQLYNDALRRNDKTDQTALLEKLSNDGNLNEILNTKGYSSDLKGLYSFVHNLENNQGKKNGLDGKFNDRDRLQILNDLGESEERVSHWEMAKTVGVNDKGQMESLIKPKFGADGKVTGWDDKEHVIAAASEIAKMDPQKIALGLNRLAYGGESADGRFELSNLGRVLLKMLDKSGAIVEQQGRLQANIANNLTQPHIVKEMREDLNISEGTIGALENRKSGKPSEYVNDLLKKINKNT